MNHNARDPHPRRDFFFSLLERLGCSGRNTLGIVDHLGFLVLDFLKTRHFFLELPDTPLYPLELLLRLGLLLFEAYEVRLFRCDGLGEHVQPLLEPVQLLFLKLGSSGAGESDQWFVDGGVECVQMRQARDLRLEAQARLGFFLRKLELSRLVFPDVRHAYLTAEITVDSVFGCVYYG
jgi:hypothetical protein